MAPVAVVVPELLAVQAPAQWVVMVERVLHLQSRAVLCIMEVEVEVEFIQPVLLEQAVPVGEEMLALTLPHLMPASVHLLIQVVVVVVHQLVQVVLVTVLPAVQVVPV
jgi:hypothetical protein